MNALERIIGRSDLMSVAFLQGALMASQTVARVRIQSGNSTVGYGSASLVAPRVLITNNHVLDSGGRARNSLPEFNYQDGVPTPRVFELDPDALFVTDRALDYTLVAVRERGTGHAHIISFGFNRVIEQEGKILIGECLNIIQHPNGELKQVAIRENQLIDILPLFLHYHTDTAPGSSGSPVFNDQWELVGLHHSGVPETDDQGRYLTKDGVLWDPSMGEHRIHWKANEGARISQIVAHLKRQTLTGSASRLRDSIFSADSAAAPLPDQVIRPEIDLASGATVHADRTATWTVPIQISVRVGDLVTMLPRRALAALADVDVVTSQAPPSATPPSDLEGAMAAVEAAVSKSHFDAECDAGAKGA